MLQFWKPLCVFYLVFVKFLDVQCVPPVSPFVKVLGQKTFQLEAATLIQIVDTGQHTLERNTVIQDTGTR